MKRAFETLEACLAIYGALAVFGNFLNWYDNIADKKKKEHESEAVLKERGKTYFKAQNRNLGTKEPLGFHIK